MLKPYEHDDIKPGEAVKIKGKWLYVHRHDGEAKELIGEFSVHQLGWGTSYYNWNDFSPEEQALLKTTLKD